MASFINGVDAVILRHDQRPIVLVESASKNNNRGAGIGKNQLSHISLYTYKEHIDGMYLGILGG